MKKNEVFQHIEIVDLSAKGKGITRINNAVVFVDHTLPGDIIDLEILRKRKGFYDAKSVLWHTKSQNRQTAICSHFDICGGCKIQNMAYDSQLEFKFQQVVNSLTRIGGLENPNILPIIGNKTTEYYRNKLEYSFSTSRWLSQAEIESEEAIENRNAVGFHAPGRFDKLVDVTHCYLQESPSNEIRNFIREYAKEKNFSFFNPYKHRGQLRSLFVRTSTTQDLMINLVFGEELTDEMEQLLQTLHTEFPQISSLFYMVNTKQNDSVYDIEAKHYSGNKFITEKINHLKFKLGPKSFYQTNSLQAVRLYEVIKEFGQFKQNEVIYDLYSGVGSIGLFLAKDVHKVIGIETVDEAVLDAEENMKFNKIDNAQYFAGQVEDLLTPEFAEKYGIADTIIIDPPRPGIHKKVIEAILNLLPKKLIYVSCNPATQARDIELLTSAYSFIKAQPVDMFPHTLHVENVSLLQLNRNYG